MHSSQSGAHQGWPQQAQQAQQAAVIKQEHSPHAYLVPKQEPVASSYPQAYPNSIAGHASGAPAAEAGYGMLGVQSSAAGTFNVQGVLHCYCDVWCRAPTLSA